MDIIIWGTGKMGRMAYVYYSGIHNIRYFVDNCPDRQGTVLEGKKVCAPSILEKEKEITVVIASKNYGEEIQKQLYNDFGIKNSVLFQVKEEYCPCGETYFPFDPNGIVVKMSGGLGNQMFQYAFGRCFEKKGKRVSYELSYYTNMERHFILADVFKNSKLTFCHPEYLSSLPVIREPDIKLVQKLEADLELLKADTGYFSGYWQSYQYVDLVRQELLEEFRFPEEKEAQLEKLAKAAASQNSVSVHIRRGDYLEDGNQKLFAGICTEEYYTRAFELILKLAGDCKFYIFSNDTEWVKEHYKNDAFTIVESKRFEDYQDWYDIYLMSCCKHNVLANSTFSWWGAWLNQYVDQIVIAPGRVVNTCDVVDFYPKEWIRLPASEKKRSDNGKQDIDGYNTNL